MNKKIADVNRPALSDEQKIMELIAYVRSCDEACIELLREAEGLKKNYDNNAKCAAEAREELKKFGIQIDNQFGGIQI